MSSLYKLDAVSLIDAYRSGQHSPGEVLAQMLKRIDGFQPQLNAYSCRSETVAEEAVASELRWQKNAAIGPLDGVPIIVKDNLAVRGMPASWGNAELARRMISGDELPVERLRQAGALILGKANTPEFAVEGYTANASFGVSANPFDTRLTPGGSSGAVAAAVASGQATMGIGTDGGGSIRRPAAYCGLVGLKPGLGHVPRANGLPQVLLDFEVVGPMTRTVRDARLMDAVLTGPSRHDPMSRRSVIAEPQQPLRLLYVPRFGHEPCDPVILQGVEGFVDRLENMGCQVSEGVMPLNLDDMTANWKTIAEIGMSRLFDADAALADSASEQYKAMAERGRAATIKQLMRILDTLSDLRRRASVMFAEWDLIVTPATAAMPWEATKAFPPEIDGQAVGYRGHAIYSGWVNAIGHPAIALPAEPSATGLPVGVQLVGDLGSETLLLDLAERYEAETDGFQWPEAFP